MPNWAVVGTGRIAETRIAPALARSSVNRLYAVASRDANRAAEFAARCGAPTSYGSFEEMLKDPDVHVVYIGSPNGLHARQTIEACQAGKHVLCDKPMALTLSDCRAMADAAARAGVKLGTGFNNRYNPVHREAQRLVSSGAVGEVLFAAIDYASFSRRASWRTDGALAGGGSLMDTGVHAVDLVRYLTGLEFAEVAAFVDASAYGWPLDEAATATFRLRGGAQGLFHAGSKYPYVRNSVRLYGSRGSLFIAETFVRQSVPEPPPPGYVEIVDEGGLRRVEFAREDMFQSMLDGFGSAVRDGTAPEVTAEDGLKAQAVILAIQESAKTGKVVKIL